MTNANEQFLSEIRMAEDAMTRAKDNYDDKTGDVLDAKYVRKQLGLAAKYLGRAVNLTRDLTPVLNSPCNPEQPPV